MTKKEIQKELDKYKLSVIINENTSLNKSQLIIDGSIRKWFTGADSTRDLTRKEFVKCINRIAQLVGLDDKSIWDAKVTQLETGVTLKFKPKYRGIINCIFDYKSFVKNTFDRYGVEFKSSNYDLIFYDQLRRVYNKKGKKQRIYNKLDKKIFVLRYEIQSHKVSGTPMFEGELDTLYKIKNNWKYIGENLIKTLEKVEIKDILSPEIFIDLINGAKTEMNKYLMYEGIKEIGVENLRTLLSQIKNKKRSEYKKYYLELFDNYQEIEKENYEVILRQKLKKRIKQLK